MNQVNQRESIRRIIGRAIPDQWIQKFHVEIEAVSESNDWYNYTHIRIKLITLSWTAQGIHSQEKWLVIN
jgi:hypothetical protein